MGEARQVLHLYKRIIRNAKVFPSKGRDRMLQEIRAEFRQNATETDPEKIQKHRVAAVKGLKQLQAYTMLEESDPNWSLKLEDHPLGGLPEEKLDAKLRKRGVTPGMLGTSKK